MEYSTNQGKQSLELQGGTFPRMSSFGQLDPVMLETRSGP